MSIGSLSGSTSNVALASLMRLGSASDATSATLDWLKSSFASLTAGSGSTSLSGFLHALKSKLADGRPSGNLIDTTA